MKYYIGADLGTSSLKLVLTDTKAKTQNSVSVKYTPDMPMESYSEQVPTVWWEAFQQGIRKLTKGFNAENIKAICVCGQMHGLVALNKEDEPVMPAILWNDARCTKETDYLNNTVGEDRLLEYTANIAVTGFTAPKILWMYNNKREAFNQTVKIMLPKDYISYMLTGNFTTDYSDASGTLLLDVKNKRWSENMLKICHITTDMLPALKESFMPVGNLSENAAKLLGLSKNTVVVCGAGDNAASAIASGTVKNGMCNISVGTSGTVFISLDKFIYSGINTVHSFCHSNGGYHLLGGIINAASCNKWFCEDILREENYAELQRGITEEKLGNNNLLFLPYLMGERCPVNDPDARGVFMGLTLNTAREDMVLAVMEGVAFAIKEILDLARENGADIKISGLCGGGAKSKLWQKVFCNILNIAINIPDSEEGASKGAAMLALTGAGEYKNIQVCVDAVAGKGTMLYPDKEIAARYNERYEKYKRLYPALKNLF